MESTGIFRVLIVEDDEILQRVLAKICKNEGWQVTVAGGGIDAIEMLKKTKPQDVPSLIFLDWNMKSGHGLWFLIQRHNLNLIPNARIYILSGDQIELSDMGLKDINILKKPVHFDVITNILKNIQARIYSACVPSL